MRYLCLTVAFVWLGAQAGYLSLMMLGWSVFWFWITAESLSQLFRKEA
jgi:hypothetical protein